MKYSKIDPKLTDILDPFSYKKLGVKFEKSRKAEICHIRFFIYQNPCVGMAKSLSWAVTKYCVGVGWAVTKYRVAVGWAVTKY